MSAAAFLQYLNQGLFVLSFVYVAIEAIRRPTRARVDTAFFFGAAALIVTETWAMAALDVDPGRLSSAFTGSLLMAMPYLLLRLVNDFTVVPTRVIRLAEVGLAASVVILFAGPRKLPVPLLLLLVGIFVALTLYDAWMIANAARQAGGVTKRRMQAVALGSGFLGLAILYSGVEAAVPALGGTVGAVIYQPLTLAAGLCYFLGFATPLVLRRAWQEPELRGFLSRAARLPRLPSTAAIVEELERGASRSLGAPFASIALWDDSAGVLRFPTWNENSGLEPGKMILGRVFAAQQAIFSRDAARDDAEHAELYRAYNAVAVLAAPITAGQRQLGVLAVFAPREPLFADDDLALVQLIADQAAVILESRALIDEAARVQAREEATRLRDEFLSAAAHDLKTPLTALLMQAQLLQRRATLYPSAPADMKGIEKLIAQTQRLRTFVVDLLDAARVETQGLITTRGPLDLTTLITEVCRQTESDAHDVVIDARGPIDGEFDRVRLAQLLDNLLRNAIKYSPRGGTIEVRAWEEDGQAHITVTDHGIGIPAADLPHIFERFQRASNVDDRRFLGMGLGLYICRGIVEQHDGQIWVTSEPGKGSTFHVVLPTARRLVTPPVERDLTTR